MKNWGISAKVLVLALLPTAAAALLLATYFITSALQDLEKSLTDRGYAIVRQLAPAAEYGVSSGNAAILQPLADAALQEADVRSVLITDAGGNALALSGMNPITATDGGYSENELVTAQTPNRGAQMFRAPIFQTELAIDSYLEKGGLPLVEERSARRTTGKILGWVSVEISREATQARRTQILVNATLITGALLMLSALLAHRMSRTIVRPILKLTDAVRSIEAGNLEVQLKTGTGAELADLARGVNAMAVALKTSQENLQERIEQATEQLRAALVAMEHKNAALDAARREAESAMRVKSDFVARMSHEIRTPLNGILGFLDLLSRTGMDGTQRDFVSKIEVSTKSLRSVINDILDFSKLEAGKLAIENVNFNLRQTIDDAVSGFTSLAHEKGLELVAIVDADVPDALIGAANRITQVMTNLLSNAVKFTASGSVILHATRAREATSEVTIRIAITDTGAGITAVDQRRLFQPFTQLETGANRSYGGTGLGLVIAKSLVETMGGEIAVESRPGDGSCFSFKLPLRRQRSIAVRQSSPMAARRVLIVSASDYICLCLKNHTATLNGTATVARNGASALEEVMSAVDSTGYDFIIIDDALPAPAQIAEEIRCARPDTSRALVLLESTSALLRPDFIVRSGFAAHLPKPPRYAELRGMFQQATERRRGDGQAVIDSANPMPAEENLRGRKLRVLLADDNQINREYLAIVLRQIGATVHEALDGAEAIEACRRDTYDIILMDVHMPRVDGCEATAKIRELMQGQPRTPIVAITADVTHASEERFRACGLDDYLIKPLAAENLMRAIEKWCPEHGAHVAAEPPAREQKHETDTQQQERQPIVDETTGLRFASGDMNRWQTALRTLAAKLPHQLEALRSALAQGRLQDVGEIAHHIHGSAAYCATPALQLAATYLEAAARRHDVSQTTDGLTRLEQEASRLVEMLRNTNAT